MKRDAKKYLGVGDLKISKRSRDLINQVLKSNRLSYGPFHQKLEKMFAKEHDVKFSLFTNSGTSALQIALHALKSTHGWKDGEEVIIPAVTFVATANIVIACRMKPGFVDVNMDDFNIDPCLIEKAITKKTRCIITVHLLGCPADMGPIMKIARKYKFKVIEDSAQTMFARYRGKAVGSIGDIGCFSTYTAHFVVTGVGGFATTNNAKLHLKMRSLMNHGRDSIYLSIDDDKNVGSKRLKEIIAKRFNFNDIGYSYRCTELEAALGVAQLEEKSKMLSRRRGNAEYLSHKLKKLNGHLKLPSKQFDRDHMFMLFGIVVRNESKENLVNFLEKHRIETRDLFPLLNQPIFQRLFVRQNKKRFPNARFLDKHAFYIGCHQYLTKADLNYIVRVFFKYFNR